MKNHVLTKISVVFISMILVYTDKIEASETSQFTYKHFIMYGQSLSAGSQSYPAISTESIPGNLVIGNQIWINYGNVLNNNFSPLIAGVSVADINVANIKSRASLTRHENPLVAAANHIQLKVPGDSIIATSCGTGGQSIEQLSKESATTHLYTKDFGNTLKYAVETAKLRNAMVECPVVYWMQGEANYSSVATPTGVGLTVGSKATGNKDEYKSLFVQLKNNMQVDVQTAYKQAYKPVFITYQTAARSAPGNDLPIGMAQLEVSNENADVICAGPVYPYPTRGVGHLDANGYRWYGEMLAKVYYKTQILKESFKPLQPIEFSRTELPNKLKIKFLVPSKPMVFDNKICYPRANYGFEVFNDNVKLTISNISIIDDCVDITCTTDLTGNINVVYGSSTNTGAGNLRDSDTYPSFYKYIDLDKKNTDGSYFYERDATETTLRPNYEPKNAAGKVIYDELYPLYNFCVAFSYTLSANEQSYKVPNLGNYTDVKQTRMEPEISVSQKNNTLIFNNIPDKDTFKLSLFKLSGEMIKSTKMTINQNQLSLDTFPKGIYLAQICSAAINNTFKVSVK